MHRCYNLRHLNKNKIIRQIIALALLLLFVFSITPQQLMHDLFANHVDCKNGIADNADIEHVNQLNFHCQVDHFVVESHFTLNMQFIEICVSPNFLQFPSLSYYFIGNDFQWQSDLRGPPLL